MPQKRQISHAYKSVLLAWVQWTSETACRRREIQHCCMPWRNHYQCWDREGQ